MQYELKIFFIFRATIHTYFSHPSLASNRSLKSFENLLQNSLLIILTRLSLASFQGRNNYCKTDPDATFMHMKDDHTRNAQPKLGYNVQIGVDSEYIVAADIFQDRNDGWTLVPFLETMEKKVEFHYPSVTADSGYESEEAYTYLREQKQKPYIKPQTYEKWKSAVSNRISANGKIWDMIK